MRTQVSWSLALVALVMSGSLVTGCKSSKHGRSVDGGFQDEDGGNPNADAGDAGANGAPGFKLSKTSGLRTEESGTTDSFTISLTSQPKADVTITVTSSDESEGKASPATIVFTTTDWSAAKTITVTGQQDEQQDGDQPYLVQFGAASSTDSAYAGKKPGDVSATNVDDDTAGVSVLGAASLSTSEPNLTTNYRLKLNTAPTADVTIALTSGDTTEVTVAPASVVFTKDNWNAEQTITLSGVDDVDLDGPITVKISSAVTSTDLRYNGIAVPDVSVINKDNETAGFFVVPSSGLRTYEDGRRGDHFTVALNSRPSANVTVPVSSSDVGEAVASPALLTFTVDNWNAPQRVNVRGVDDADKDGDQPFTIVLAAATSADSRFMGADPQDVTGLNVDDESAGFSVDDEVLTATEGGRPASFTLSLNSRPTANVTVAISSVTPAQATVSPASMIFTPDNWNAPQKVTITAVDDSLADGPQTVTIDLAAATSPDSRYDGKKPDSVSVSVLDNDSPGLNVDPADLTTSESGAAGAFTVALYSKPTATVTVPVASLDEGEITLAPKTLVFTVDNWQAAQQVTLTGVDDDLVDRDQQVKLTIGPATSSDVGYNGKTADPLFATNVDNDSAGVTIEPSVGLETTESGGQASFTVALNKKPTANVTFALSVTNANEATISPVTLTFTPDNFDGKQTVTLRGVEDMDVADGDQRYEVVFAPAMSTDGDYNGFTPDRLAAINRDNDSPGIVPSVTGGLSTSEAGGTATFNVKLKSRPTQPVTLTIASSRPAEGIANPLTINFLPDDWNGTRTVTLTGQEDLVADGTQPYQVLITSASDDARYAGLTALVDAVNTDNDSAGVAIKLRAGDTLPLITREDGSTARFSVALHSKPTQNVVIPLSSTRGTEGTVSPAQLTFTPDNWNGEQDVVLTGVGDLKEDGDQQYFVAFGPITGDATYAALAPLDRIELLNIDTDSAGIFVSSGQLITSEDGTSATFKISLRRAPSQDVTIPITSSSVGEGLVTPSSVTFTSVSFAETIITVTGLDDQVADGRQAYQVVFGPAVSNDASYAGRVAPALTAYNDDNDSPGFTVNLVGVPAGDPISTTEVTPPGSPSTQTIEISLHSKPVGNITVPITVSKPNEVDVSPASITFLASDTFPSIKTVTVTSKNDLVQDGNQAYTLQIGPAMPTSADANYAGLTYPPIDGINIDNDTAGIDVNAANPLITYEDQSFGAATFQVKLLSQPTANVTLTVVSSNTAEGTVNPVTLTFTPGLTGSPGSYADPQTVSVKGVDDAVADHDQQYSITLKTDPAGTDATYAALPARTLPALNTDDDTPGVVITGNTGSDFATVSPFALNPVNEAGTTQRKFVVQLRSQPTATVSIDLASDDLGEVSVDTNSLVFTTANWNVPRVVTVTGVDDSIDDGDQSRHVVLAAPLSDDPLYNALPSVSISVLNENNDSAGFEVSKANVSTYEEGTVDTFTVKLTSQPTADVIVGVSSTDTTEATVVPASLTFTAANWNVTQTVSVTGVNDLAIDLDQSYGIHLAAALSADPKYAGLAPAHGVDVAGISYEAATSCLDLHTLVPSLPSAVYRLDTDLDGTASPRFWGYCDMTTAANGTTGGWTLLSWTGDSEALGGLPYPGLNFVETNAISAVNRASAVPPGALRALFDDSSELAQAQAITTAGRAAITKFGNLTAYEFVGTFAYNTLSDLTLGAAFTGCTGLKTGTYTSIKDPDSATLNNGTQVFLNQNLNYADDATLSNFTPAASYVWSIGNKTAYCALNGTAPASFVGTWQDGQYGPRYPNAAGAYSVWVR
ncbi:MAG: hypothetical protein JWN48_1084 [Myxococcaceae bacterium]|nr:hypothetical protein [Myxococcaceae bacterium]